MRIQILQGFEEVFHGVVVSDEKSFVEFLVEEFNEVGSACWRHLKREIFQFQSHCIYFLHRLRSINKILNLMRDLKGLVKILPITGQPHIGCKNSNEIDGEGIDGGGRNIFKGMFEDALLLNLLDKGGVHVEVHGGVVAGEIVVVVREDLFFDGDGVEDEAEIGVALEIAEVADK